LWIRPEPRNHLTNFVNGWQAHILKWPARILAGVTRRVRVASGAKVKPCSAASVDFDLALSSLSAYGHGAWKAKISMEIRIELPAVKLGVLEADDLSVTLVNEGLANLTDKVCEQQRRAFTLETLAAAPPIRAVREMFRRWGVDPSKYRPSSEALMRRVVQGKGLYRVSNVVDIGNLGSVETGWPYGCYDLAKLCPPIIFRHGLRGEIYEGIGKRAWHLEGRPVLADADGPFGSPISDSNRSMITEASRQALIVIYAPATSDDISVERALGRVAERLSQFAGAKTASTHICR
jgi:DNA/RNA-binding domain of Phe-tRNA-synthetase-like protein